MTETFLTWISINQNTILKNLHFHHVTEVQGKLFRCDDSLGRRFIITR